MSIVFFLPVWLTPLGGYQMMKTLSNLLSNIRIKYISNAINQQICQQSTRDLLCIVVLTTFFDYYAPAREHSLFFTFIGSQICKYGFLNKKTGVAFNDSFNKKVLGAIEI